MALFCDQFDAKDIEKCFKWLDKDSNGVVDEKDFSQIVRDAGQVASDKASLQAIQRIDDKSKVTGTIADVDSFKAMVNEQNKMNEIDSSLETFKYFDKDSTNLITAQNLVDGFTELGETITLADARQIIKIVVDDPSKTKLDDTAGLTVEQFGELLNCTGKFKGMMSNSS